jgi:hypothetical protein
MNEIGYLGCRIADLDAQARRRQRNCPAAVASAIVARRQHAWHRHLSQFQSQNLIDFVMRALQLCLYSRRFILQENL